MDKTDNTYNAGSTSQNESRQNSAWEEMRDLLQKTFPQQDLKQLLISEIIDPEEEFFPFLRNAIQRQFSYEKIKECIFAGLDIASMHPATFYFLREWAEDAAQKIQKNKEF